MTRHMFAPAAVSCLVDGRAPRQDEVDEMAAKIWREAYHRVWQIEWSDVEPGSRLHASILAAALAALGALAGVMPQILDAAA